MPGAIQRRRYLGNRVTYRVKLASGPSITVDVPGRAGDRREGDAVAVVFDPAATMLVAR